MVEIRIERTVSMRALLILSPASLLLISPSNNLGLYDLS